VVRANFVYGHLTDAMRLSQINKNISKNTQFARTPVASDAMTYAVEAGYNVMSIFGSRQRIIPFARYEYYNSAEKVPVEMSAMPINKRDLLTAGVNYAILPNLLVKADYSVRRLDRGSFNNENTFSIALAYTGWFFQR
jgi:long-subunit fatty acid transport protein